MTGLRLYGNQLQKIGCSGKLNFFQIRYLKIYSVIKI